MYNSNDIPLRIKALAKEKGIKIKQVLEKAQIGDNAMAHMKTSMPKADNLAKIADELDCSVDYLLGRTENPDAHIKSSETNNQVIELLLQLTPEQQEMISLQIKGLLAAKKSSPPEGSEQG